MYSIIHVFQNIECVNCVIENLASNADNFRVKARGLKSQMWWKECRVSLPGYYGYCKLKKKNRLPLLLYIIMDIIKDIIT